ncbi:hypothetical protein PC129_g24063 [Phytophthora cactorum]|uniref:Uncharacterized protein n=1 Tax=Phytophthora cactorum TaxID=29920 RepID=A0A8T1AEW4_9STRA|nr:hypothetical protein Pcac1_g8339 [Phytophthora cactorum]KAG2791265.1 hypothetical protein PC111_g24007 [Phytophthora cactorum]KAG2792707.1 hypothetical protein PC112_g23751 [Phytophthora cactorum]KAG2823727.1 hypothetical protein PC113_g22144 [Phytophthora cactorum]KAG2872695.1 hypothetical protein PC114_g26248 [Phytophthora cactorum]
MAPINDVWTRNHGSVEIRMVVEGVASASTTTTQALPLCPLVGWNHGSTFLVTKPIALLARFLFFLGFFFQLSLVPNTIALSPSFAFFLCLTCPPLFLISAIASTIRLLSSTGTLPLGVYTSSAVSLGGCQVGTSGASSISISCPSTFRLRSGHGCAPPSSLFSLALATLPLKFLRSCNSL